MKRYEYTIISRSGLVTFTTTDYELIDLLYDQAKKIVPGCNLEVYKFRRGIAYINNMPTDKNGEVRDVLLKYLCNNGWEPFAVEPAFLHLRREINS